MSFVLQPWQLLVEGQWMQQIARNLADCDEGFLLGKKYLIMDRDTKFTQRFRGLLKESGVKAIRLPPRSPKMSAHLERPKSHAGFMVARTATLLRPDLRPRIQTIVHHNSRFNSAATHIAKCT